MKIELYAAITAGIINSPLRMLSDFLSPREVRLMRHPINEAVQRRGLREEADPKLRDTIHNYLILRGWKKVNKGAWGAGYDWRRTNA